MTMSEKLMDRLTARGLDVELMDRMGIDGQKNSDGGEALVIPFLREGQRIRRKYRFFDDPKGRKWTQDKDCVRSAWNEDCLRDDNLLSQPLVVTEGEFDALSAIQCGFERTISVPDGAPPPGDRSAEDLAESKKYEWFFALQPLVVKDRIPFVILAVDGDTNGAALRQDLINLFGRARCKFVIYPLAKDPEKRGRARLKDLNEVLEDYGPKGVGETLNRAEWVESDGVYYNSALPELPASQIYEIGFDALGDHYKMRLGDFAVWTGIPMHGKSSIVQDVCCRVAERYGVRVGWASFEQTPQRDHRRAFRTWFHRTPEWRQSDFQKSEADAWIDRHHAFIVPKLSDDVTLDWLVERMEVAATRFECKVIVIDPWNEMDHLWDRNETEAQYINRAIKLLRRFARAFQVHLIVVAHPTKIQRGSNGLYSMPDLYDINGGAVWRNKCDLGVIVHRESETDTRVRVEKSRYHDVIGKPGSVVMQYSMEDRRYRECERLP